MKNRRLKEVRKRRSFWPTLVLTVLLVGVLAGLIYFVDPGAAGAVPAFFILTFLFLLFGFSLLFANSRRGLLIASDLTILLILRYFGIGNILNLLLILGITASIEAYAHVHS